MEFKYYAKKISGEEKRGTIEAKNQTELAKMLRKEEYILISSEKKDAETKFSLSSIALISFNKISIVDKVLFNRNLSIMISAGLSLTRALDVLSKQTKNKKLYKIINELSDDIKKGETLHEAMGKFPKTFTPHSVAMVRAGEESGKLSESLTLISEQLEHEHELKKRIRSAMIYPAIILTSMMVIGILMLMLVVPTLISTFEELGVELPISTQIILKTSELLTEHPILILGSILILVFLTPVLFRNESVKKIKNRILIKTPIISTLIKKINSAQTTRTLSSLISSGIDVLEALSITKDVLQNDLYKKVIEQTKDDIQKGLPISESFRKAENLYPSLVGEMIAVGEETGELSSMLVKLASFYEEEVSTATKDMATIIEPFLMIIVGAIVGFFALSMITPMYSVMSGI